MQRVLLSTSASGLDQSKIRKKSLLILKKVTYVQIVYTWKNSLISQSAGVVQDIGLAVCPRLNGIKFIVQAELRKTRAGIAESYHNQGQKMSRGLTGFCCQRLGENR